MPSTRYSGVWTLTQAQQAIRNQNWTNIPPPNVECLVVAGGGSGGGSYGGGGGAGGLRADFTGVIPGSAITVTVGAGGAASSNNGNNSVFGAITAQAGGAGGSPGSGGSDGGSGGGAGGGGTSNYYQPGIGTVGQGNNGGANTAQASVGPAGGGGGAGTNGATSVASVAGIGGDGIASRISGAVTMYAGGGGGGTISGDFGTGGLGGGGNGANNTNGSAGTANTGGGGGGGGGGSSAGGAGGSGIVIISYPDIYAPAVSTTGSPTVTTSGSGSLYFDGTGDYLSYANGSFNLSNSNFVVEAFIYLPSAISGFTRSIASGNTDAATAAGSSWDMSINTSQKFTCTVWIGSTNYTIISTASISTLQWVHLAFVRTGGTISMFIDGAKDGTNTTLGTGSVQNGSTTYPPQVGRNGASADFPGYISNFRLIVGTIPSSYDATASTITVPNAPLTAVSNTQLLLSAMSGSQFADSSGNNRNATVAGNTVWNSLSPFPTGAGFKNRVYQWTSSGSVTF